MYGKCERCHGDTMITSMSIFNTQMICPICQDKESKHPKFNEAREAERKAVVAGNVNFPGIGKPSDL